MEYCEGGNLTSYARANHFRLQSEEILNIFKQIVMAFLAMNAKRVIHRDLKPDNILISKGMVIKIADFGCARFVEKEKMSVTIKDNLSVGIGTPLFSSPEVLTDQMYSAKCDVWSAGCLLYSICEGGNPFAQKEKDIITCIKELMVNGQIRLKTKNSNPKICRLISLTLVFTEKERATWRELWLSRLFVPSVDNVWAFV